MQPGHINEVLQWTRLILSTELTLFYSTMLSCQDFPDHGNCHCILMITCNERLFFDNFGKFHHLHRHCCHIVSSVNFRDSLWTLIEDYGCITSHAQSTAATHFTFAVKSDVVHLIVVCWALLLQSFGAEQIVHTRWPTEIFAHACVEIKSISTPFMCTPSRNKA